jgi:hypothetical protein
MLSDTSEQPPAPPADPSGEEDRLPIGVVHLLVWTAGVAVYLGLGRAAGQIYLDLSQPFGGASSAIATTLTAIGYGAALGGLILWASRRRRGLAFPKHPGEYLLVVIALGQVLRFSYAFVARPVTPERLPLITALMFGYHVLEGLILLWPLLAVKNRGWRKFFGTLLGAQVLLILLLATSRPEILLRAPAVFDVLALGCVALTVAADVILLVIVFKDYRKGNRYPWTHWLGVVVKLWIALLSIDSLATVTVMLVQSTFY